MLMSQIGINKKSCRMRKSLSPALEGPYIKAAGYRIILG